MHAEVQELQAKLKEILYHCAVDIKASKAALYLLDTPTNRFEMITEYGFEGAARPAADSKNPIVDKCERTRSPFFFEMQSDRLLIAPIYLRGQLVGIIDMRDKDGKEPFETFDLRKAQTVSDRIAELFGNKNVWEQRFVTPLPQPSPVAQAASYTPRVSSLILEARTAAERVRNAVAVDTLSETEMNIVREIVRAVLLIPGALVAAFSALGHLGGIQEIASRALLTDDALALLQSKFNAWLTKRGESGATLRNRMQTPFGTTGAAIREQDIKKVFTAPITAGSIRGLYLSVGFSGEPERSTHELLAAFHQQLQLAIEQSLSRRHLVAARLRIAEKVVEPDFSRFPELRRHSNAVVARVEAFARFLTMTPVEIDTAKVVALVHDAGMRLLDYDRLYRKRDPSPDDMNILREHPVVGAAIIEPLLGPEAARAVLSHHERWDGRGYPNELVGEEIPLTSRILQICDVYEAMTAMDGYQSPQSHDTTMAVIARDAGVQFDPDLARRFEEMMLRAR